MGRPAIGDRIHVAVGPAVRAQLDAIAEERQVTRSELIRRLLVKALGSPRLIDAAAPPVVEGVEGEINA